jgi:hypothetical protein
LEQQWLAARKKQGMAVAPKVLERYKQIAAETWK